MEWAGANDCSAPGSFAGTLGARLRIACPFVDCFPSSSPRQLFFVLGCWACAHGAARVKPRSSQLVLRSRLLPRQQRASDRHLAGAYAGVGGVTRDGPSARRLPTRTSFALAAGAAARFCSTPRRSVRGCRRIHEEPAPSARRLLFLPTHRALFLTSCRRAEGLAPVALRSRMGSESGERLRISRTPQRNLFCSSPFRFGFSWWRSPILAPKGGVDRCPSLALRSRIAALSSPDRTASAWWRRPWPQSG